MFTGIVASTGTLQARESHDGDLRIRFEVPAFLMEGCGVAAWEVANQVTR